MRTDLRRPLAAANWKMHLGREEAQAWCRAVGAEVGAGAEGEVAVFPSFPLIPPVVAALAGTPVEVGGQDLHADDKGAHTGDVSGAQLADAGCRLVLCGHSERRRDHAESDELVGRKVATAARLGLWPLLCVGETREERQRGETFAVLARQLGAALACAPVRLIVAYEPVWAIGTGETATPELAQAAHAFLRGALGAVPLGIASERVRLLYGGSVTPDNAAELAAQPDIDGFLVGGASLDPRKFIDIIRVCGSVDGASRSSTS